MERPTLPAPSANRAPHCSRISSVTLDQTADAHVPGTRTGTYRSSTTAQLKDTDPRSRIGGEDYAIAFADEVERPTVRRDWLIVGY
jgi:putative NADH-flavin reductase